MYEIIIAGITVVGSLLTSFVTAKLSVKSEIKKLRLQWEHDHDEYLLETMTSAASAVHRFVGESHNVYQKNVAIERVAAVLLMTAGETNALWQNVMNQLNRNTVNPLLLQESVQKLNGIATKQSSRAKRGK